MKYKILSVGTALLLASSAGAQTPPDILHGSVRLRAGFESGKAELDLGSSERHFSRVWMGTAYNKSPDDTRSNRVGFSDLLEAGRNGKYSFATKTDVGFRATGAFNFHSGTLAGWFRKSEIFQNGGLLLAAKAWPTGGPRGTVHWALGIGGAPGSDVPANKIFVVANDVQTIAATDLPGDEWVHLTAVWDGAHGAKLYANGQLISSHWSQTPPQPNETQSTPAVFPNGNFVDEIAKWRASLGTAAGRKFAPLLEEGAFAGVKVSREKSAATGTEVLKLEKSSSERLQIRSLTPLLLNKGQYQVLIRVRRDVQASGAGSASDISARLTRSNPAQDTPELTRISSVAGTPTDEIHLAQTVTIADGDRLIFDLNFNNSGVYCIEEFAVRAVEAQPQNGRTKTTLKLPGGAAPFVTNSSSYPVERFHLLPSESGAVDDLVVFDFPLDAIGVQELFAGKTPEYSRAEPTSLDIVARLAELGWTEGDAPGLIPLASGKPLNIRQATIASAKENLRAAGWLAVDGFPASQSPWWYHGYGQIPKTIGLAFENPFPVNYIAAQGTFSGTLEGGNAGSALTIQPENSVFRRFLSAPLSAQNFTLRHEQGLLNEISFYSIGGGTSESAGRELSFNLQPATGDIPLQSVKRDEFISAYPVRDRSTLVGVPGARMQASPISIPALQTFHLMTPALAEEFPLGAIEIWLRGKSPANRARLRVVAHDALTPWRELARLDFVLEKNTPEFEANLNLDLRDTLIRKGDVVWLSLVCDAPLEISSGAASTITLRAAADAARAEKLWRDWELNSVRDRFESMSEPRPWRDVGEEKETSWWLGVTSPEYEWLDASLRVLRERFPDDATVNSWFAFTHPSTPNPATGWPLPETGAHPRWAVLLKENLQLYKQFLNYWIDNRLHPNGEWGHGYFDDSDLMQEWLDGALISDSDGRIANSLVYTADSIWHRFKLKDGSPIIENGLNNRWTDLLHAYEEGLNIQPQAFLLNYGDPEYLSRLLATAARYDSYLMTPAQNGKRHFAGSGDKAMAFVSSTRPPEGRADDRAWFLLTHPGLMLSWYNRHPATFKTLRELGDGMLDESLKTPPLLAYGGTSFYYGLYRMTGDERYLSTLLNAEQRKNGVLSPRHNSITGYSIFGLLSDYDRKKTFDWLQQDAATRFDSLGTYHLGFGDTRFEQNWAAWHLTKDKAHLNAGLEQLYRKLKYIMPSLTEAEQSGDRVSIAKQLISRAYLGGVPSARNHSFYPDFAVSYEGLSDNYAALVAENQADVLQVIFYNFEAQSQNGAMKVWNLDPGKYELTAGPDADGDDKIDKVETTQEYSLERGANVPLSLPSQSTWIVRLRLLEKTTPLAERVDAGVSSKLLRRVGSTLHVPVFNTGTKPIPRLKVLLRSADGAQQQERVIENLPGNEGWTLASQEVEFPLEAGATSWIIELDPDRELEEITRANNRAEVSY